MKASRIRRILPRKIRPRNADGADFRGFSNLKDSVLIRGRLWRWYAYASDVIYQPIDTIYVGQ